MAQIVTAVYLRGKRPDMKPLGDRAANPDAIVEVTIPWAEVVTGTHVEGDTLLVAAGMQKEAGEMSSIYLPMYIFSVFSLAVVIVLAVTLIETTLVDGDDAMSMPPSMPPPYSPT